MSSKPVVALIMPEATWKWMFGEEGLSELKTIAEVRGPGMIDTPKIKEALADAQVIITGWGSPRCDDQLLAMAPRLGFLAHSAGTVKGIVDGAVYARGIRVSTAAAANARPVAEYTVAMMGALLKQMPWIIRALPAGLPKNHPRLSQLRELQDMTIGLIGASRVGREVIRLLHAYHNLTIKLYDPSISPSQATLMGATLVPLDEVCACTVVSVHAPSIPQTHHMLNAATLALLPDHAVLINTARGSLIDENALIAEVRRRPLYVLLDVTDPEPPPAHSPLRHEENILITPHIAGAMNQARRDMGRLAEQETLRFLRGEPLEHEVTEQMLATQA